MAAERIEHTRFFASGPTGEFFASSYALAESLIRHRCDRDDWTITVLSPNDASELIKRPSWIKWLVAKAEITELDRWRSEWEEHRRWFAEFPEAAAALDHMKAAVDGKPTTFIHAVRDSVREGRAALARSQGEGA